MKTKLKPRPSYLEKLKKFKDVNAIKVLTGMRRTGKSSLLKMLSQILRSEGIDEANIIEMDFTSLNFSEMKYREIYDYIIDRYKGGRLYVFLEEIQVVDGWEKAVNSLKADIDCDIYITGSNAYLLSGELATLLSGRYIVIPVYPLSFQEYIDFLELKTEENPSLNGNSKYSFKDKNGEIVNSADILNRFIRYGSLPELSTTQFDEEVLFTFLEGIYDSVFRRDIITRTDRLNVTLLEKIIRFLTDNIGNRTSANSVKNKLISSRLSKQIATYQKVQACIKACNNAFLFYPAKRYDVRGKEELNTLEKYYITDLGMRTLILQDRPGDREHILENLVYMELLKRGFNVQVGKRDNLEIDFIARKGEKRFDIQVTQSLEDSKVYNREIAPLKKETESYKRLIIAENTGINNTMDSGIQIISLLDFLLDPSYLT